jgi:tRNA(Ile)-lysidine synthase
MDGSTTLTSRFREFTHAQGLLDKGDRVVVAVSGGVDSVVLLRLLAAEQKRLDLTFVVAHYNHQLRGSAADEDAAFVRQLAVGMGLPVSEGSGNVQEEARRIGRGIEDAARTMRYAFLEGVRVASGCNRIATGHNADDNAETVLLNLLRGSGVKGLAGIPARRDGGMIIRPLLFATRDEIVAFANATGLQWREDSSNASDAYRRNILRHNVLPLVRERINPGIARTMLRTAEVFRELDDYLTRIARTGLDQATVGRTGREVRLSCTHLLSLPTVVQDATFQLAVAEHTGRRLTFDRCAALSGLVHQQSGRFVELGGGWRAERIGEEIAINAGGTPVPFLETLRAGSSVSIPGGTISSAIVAPPEDLRHHSGMTEYIDADSIGTGELIVRSWRDGDTFLPLGMIGHKLVSDVLGEAGIPSLLKAGHPLVTTAGEDIVWVCGIRLDDRFKVTEHTHRVLQLTYSRSVEDTHGEATENQW